MGISTLCKDVNGGIARASQWHIKGLPLESHGHMNDTPTMAKRGQSRVFGTIEANWEAN